MEKLPIKKLTNIADYCENSCDQPVKEFIPNQAISLRELVTRFERGQRLNVHQNFAPMSNFTNGNTIYEEDFNDAPPDDVHDIVDVHEHYLKHNEQKADYIRRKKEKGKKPKPAPAQQGDAPNPPDPSVSNPSE